MMQQRATLATMQLVGVLWCGAALAAEPSAPPTQTEGATAGETTPVPTSNAPTVEAKPTPTKEASLPPAPAQAEEAKPAVKAQPDESVAAEPGAKGGAHYHDGFYARVGLGGGYLAVGTNYDISINGGGLGLDLMFGGTPSPGVTIGGGYWFNSASSPKVDDIKMAGSINFGVIGPFVDFYPNPSGGFHAGAILGAAIVTASSDSGATEGGDRGFGGGLFAGYDFWISDEWSLGGQVRGSLGSVSNDDEKLKPKNISFMLDALYH